MDKIFRFKVKNPVLVTSGLQSRDLSSEGVLRSHLKISVYGIVIVIITAIFFSLTMKKIKSDTQMGGW
jgi:hypothetical protein